MAWLDTKQRVPETFNNDLPFLIECYFCAGNKDKQVPATTIAGQYHGGDEQGPYVWIPICDAHFDNWWEDVEDNMRLPSFPLVKNTIGD